VAIREAHVEFQPKSTAPAMGRRVLGGLVDRIPERSLEDARLLLTEVMTNAIRHAQGGGEEPITVSLSVVGDELVVQVADPGEGFDARRPHGTTAGTGWGLFLLEQIASVWGVERRPGGGSVVWFRLGLRSE
jgi:anti-sigma regulatory factor (Ser/Thr protein kinase)